ncbi:MAG: hypothetical protein WA277_09045 [Nitrospirota bacterium]
MNKLDFKNMSDAQLIEIINTDHDSKITNNIKNAARSELHSRQKKIDLSTNKMTLWILILTIILVVLTLVIIVFEFRTSIEAKPNQSMVNKPLPQQHNPTENSLTLKEYKGQ